MMKGLNLTSWPEESEFKGSTAVVGLVLFLSFFQDAHRVGGRGMARVVTPSKYLIIEGQQH